MSDIGDPNRPPENTLPPESLRRIDGELRDQILAVRNIDNPKTDRTSEDVMATAGNIPRLILNIDRTIKSIGKQNPQAGNVAEALWVLYELYDRMSRAGFTTDYQSLLPEGQKAFDLLEKHGIKPVLARGEN